LGPLSIIIINNNIYKKKKTHTTAQENLFFFYIKKKRLKNLKQIQQLDVIEVFNITVQNPNGYGLGDLANHMKAPRILDNREDELRIIGEFTIISYTFFF